VVVGVDVGGTKILGVAVDPARPETPLACAEVPTARGAAAVGAAIDEVIDEVIDRVTAEIGAAGPPAAIGIGMPGLVTLTGNLRYGPNLPGVVDTDIAAELRPRPGALLVVDNDGNCAAWAEHRLGAGRGADDVTFIGLGTGISCGLVVGGRLVRGAHGYAGEPGHMTMQPGGPVCACGRLGCWEAFASGHALARLAREEVAVGRAPGLAAAVAGGELDELWGQHVTAAAAAGDPDAGRVLDRYAGFVAAGLVTVVNLIDPAVVVLGGSVMTAADEVLPRVRRAYAADALGGALAQPPEIVAAALGREAGAIGAALLAGNAVNGRPRGQ
jgi:glucokinase